MGRLRMAKPTNWIGGRFGNLPAASPLVFSYLAGPENVNRQLGPSIH
jgi:hypothetical protein